MHTFITNAKTQKPQKLDWLPDKIKASHLRETLYGHIKRVILNWLLKH